MNQISIITVTRSRTELLKQKALPSLQNQTCSNFTWIVINDGGDVQTKELIETVKVNSFFRIIYREIDHPNRGFALCHGRNFGLKLARTDLVTYLDDDNALYPEFIACMSQFMSVNSQVKLALPLQKRCRQVWHNGNVVVGGKTFISPGSNASIDDLICHRQLIDSNGLTHRLSNAPQWNQEYRIYCDYEYVLQCLSQWGKKSLSLCSQILVEYVQTNQGIIGQSSYGNWAKELKQILTSQENYQILVNNPEYLSSLSLLQHKYNLKHQQQIKVAAFTEDSNGRKSGNLSIDSGKHPETNC